MRKHYLLTLVACLFAVAAWAADVSVKETFSRVTGVSTGTTASGLERTGDLCTWKATNVRYAGSNDKITISGTATNAWWLPKSSSTTYGKIETTNLEGGIKAVSFYWAQFAGNEGGNTLKLKVKAGSIEHNPAVERDGSLGGNKANPGDPYTHTFNCKTNGQLEISNVSTWETKAGDCRILVGPVTITPYLLYRQKDVTIGLRQQGYYNGELINNTGSNAIEYISGNEGIATVDDNGVITPKAVGNTTITAKYTWSATEFVTTTYTLHVEDGVFVENFSKVKQTSQTSVETPWSGDLFGWEGHCIRRGADDTLGLNPRIQATAMRYVATGTYLQTADTIEGGVKHVYFDWRQWASANADLNMDVYYSKDKTNWGTAVSEAEAAATASTPHTFDADIDADGSKGNAYLKISYTSGGAHAVVGAIKITPWLLYLTKEATMNTSNGWTYTNADLMNNTGATPSYSIRPANADVTIDADGQVIVTENAEVNGDFVVTAKWNEVNTSYTLHIQSRINTTAWFDRDKKYANVGGSVSNALNTNRSDVPAYTSSNEAVAKVANDGTITLEGSVGETTITATYNETESYTAATASYKIYVTDNNARKEAFAGITTENTVDNKKELDWNGLFAWKGWQVRRYTGSDTIWNTTTLGTWIRMNTTAGYLKSADAIEGGIKYLSFYWKQWGAETGKTLRLAVYAGDTQVESMQRKADSYGAGDARHEKYLFGAKNVMTSSKQLTIRNESYIDANNNDALDEGELATSNGRMIIDTIYITPWLLYTDKSEQVMRVGDEYTREIINYTAGEAGTLSYSSSNETIAEVSNDGKVTAKKYGYVTITAKFAWDNSEDFVATSYKVAVYPATNCETFVNVSKMCIVAPSATSCSQTPVTDELDNNIKWSYWLGGGNTAVFGRNAMYLRARTKDESQNDIDFGYLKSEAIAGGLTSLTFAWNQGGTEANVTYNVKVVVNGDTIGTIDSIGRSETYETPRIFHVENLDYRGNVIIEVINKTAYSGDKSRGRMVIDFLAWEGNASGIVLDENADNSSVIAANSGATVDVELTRSALVGGVWNTLCLPFELPVSTLGVVENGVQTLHSADLSADGSELTVGFTPFGGETLEAGVPYLVKPASNVVISGTYDNVYITSVASPVAVGSGIITLQGIFSPYAMTGGDTNTLFVGTPKANGDNLFYPSQDGSLKGFRAYFTLNLPSGAAPKRARFVVNQEEVATGVEGVQNTEYRVQKTIENGQLVIIREGKMYNAQGMRIR